MHMPFAIRKGVIFLTTEETRVPREDAEAMLAIYNGIGDAERRCKPCMGSAYRTLVRKRLDDAGEAYETFAKARDKPNRKGIIVMKFAVSRLVTMYEALESALSNYAADSQGNALFRDYVRGVWQAASNRQAAEELSKVLSA